MHAFSITTKYCRDFWAWARDFSPQMQNWQKAQEEDL